MKKILMPFLILMSFFYAGTSLADWVNYRVCSDVKGVMIVHGPYFREIPQGGCLPSKDGFFHETTILSGVSLAMDREDTTFRPGNLDSYLVRQKEVIVHVKRATILLPQRQYPCGIDANNPDYDYFRYKISFTVSGKSGEVEACGSR